MSSVLRAVSDTECVHSYSASTVPNTSLGFRSCGWRMVCWGQRGCLMPRSVFSERSMGPLPQNPLGCACRKWVFTPTPRPSRWNLREWAPGICISATPPDDSEAHDSLSLTGLVWETEAERTASNMWQNEAIVVAAALPECIRGGEAPR